MRKAEAKITGARQPQVREMVPAVGLNGSFGTVMMEIGGERTLVR